MLTLDCVSGLHECIRNSPKPPLVKTRLSNTEKVLYCFRIKTLLCVEFFRLKFKYSKLKVVLEMNLIRLMILILAQSLNYSTSMFLFYVYIFVPCLLLGLRACLHGGGGPQVGEVTRLAVVEEWPAFTCKLTTPGSRGDFT